MLKLLFNATAGLVQKGGQLAKPQPKGEVFYVKKFAIFFSFARSSDHHMKVYQQQKKI